MAAEQLLVVKRNGEKIKEQPFEQEALLGRGDDCALKLQDRAISRRHALFRSLDGGVQVEKQSEFAPLVVNGEECTTAMVREGDVVKLGPYEIEVVGPSAPAADVPDPLADLDGEAQPVAPIPVDGEIQQEEAAPPVEEFDPPPMPEADLSMAAMAPLTGGELQEDGAEIPQFDSGIQDAPASNIPEPAPSTPDGETQALEPERLRAKIVLPPGVANFTEYNIGPGQEVVLGRSKKCDITLQDKKSSRKNTSIRSDGSRFVIKDLNSINGTFVNGRRLEGEQELAGEDRVQIGDIEFAFSITSLDYEEAKNQFLPLGDEAVGEFGDSQPLSVMESPGVPAEVAFAGVAGAPAIGDPAAAVPGAAPAAEGSPPKGGLLSQIKSNDELRKKILYGIVVAIMAWVVLGEEAEPPKKAQPKTQATAQKDDKKAEANRGLESLSPEQQKFVRAQYELALSYMKQRDYDAALFEIQKVFKFVPNSEYARDLERYALEGKRRMKALEDEKKRKEEDRQRRLELARLTERAGFLMKRRRYEAASALFPEILALDPENIQVPEWQKLIEEREEKKRIQDEERRIRREIYAQGKKVLDQGLALAKSGDCFSAFGKYKEVPKIAPNSPRLKAQAKAEIRRCEDQISGRYTPLMEEGKNLEEQAEYAQSFTKYEEASKIDPRKKEPKEGMERVQSVLHERAKIMYTEGVLAESYSDFELAKERFEAIVQSTPKSDLYYGRAQRKLARYKVLKSATSEEVF